MEKGKKKERSLFFWEPCSRILSILMSLAMVLSSSGVSGIIRNAAAAASVRKVLSEDNYPNTDADSYFKASYSDFSVSYGDELKKYDYGTTHGTTSNSDRYYFYFVPDTLNKIDIRNAFTVTMANIVSIGGRRVDYKFTADEIVLDATDDERYRNEKYYYFSLYVSNSGNEPRLCTIGSTYNEGNEYTNRRPFELHYTVEFTYHDTGKTVDLPFYRLCSDIDVNKSSSYGYVESYIFNDDEMGSYYLWEDSQLKTARSSGTTQFYNPVEDQDTTGNDTYALVGLIATTNDGKWSAVYTGGNCGSSLYIGSDYISLESPVKKESVSSCVYGDEITYTVTRTMGDFYNDTFTTYTSLVFTDVLDSRLTYVDGSLKMTSGSSDVTSSGTAKYDSSSHTLTFTFGSSWLSSVSNYKGQELAMTFSAKADGTSKNGEEISNRASTSLSGIELESNTVTVTVESPVMNITKTSDQDSYSLGDEVTYTLTVKQTNSNVSTAANVTVTDTVPDGLELSGTPSVSGVSNSSVTTNGNSFTVVIPEMKTSETAVITVKATAVEASSDGLAVTNTAKVTADGGDGDDDSVDVELLMPKLEVVKTPSDMMYNIRDTIDYSITLKRTVEGATAYDVVLTDAEIDSNLTYIDDSLEISGKDASQYSLSQEADGSFTLTIDSLSYGETVVVTFSAAVNDDVLKKVDDPDDVRVYNTITATFRGDPDADSPASSTSVNGIYNPHMVVSKTSDSEYYNVKDSAKFTVTLSQSVEGAIAYGVIIKDTDITDGVLVDMNTIEVEGYDRDAIDIVQNSDGGFEIRFKEGISDEIIVITYEARIASNELAGVEISNRVICTNESNDETVETTREVPVLKPELTIEKTSDSDAYNIKDRVVYTLTVKQTVEDAVANDVVITDLGVTEGVELDMLTLKIEGISSSLYRIVDDEENPFEIHIISLPYGRTVTISIEGTIVDSSLVGKEITNTADVTCSNNPEVVSDEAVAPIYKPEIVLSKEADGSRYNVDDYVTYTIHAVQLVEGGRANDVVISDSIDMGMEIDFDSFIVAVDGKTLSNDEYGLEEMDYGFRIVLDSVWSEASITYRALVEDASLAGTYVDNVVGASSTNIEKIDTPDAATVEIMKPEFSIEKTSDREIYNYDDEVEYTVKVTRTAEYAKGLDLIITDSDFTDGLVVSMESISVEVPEGTTYDIHEAEENEKSAYDHTSFYITATPLEYGESIIITFRARIADPDLAGKTVFNVASVTARNNSEIVEGSIENPVYKPELTIEKSSDDVRYNIDDMVHYTIVVEQTNEGARAQDIIITDEATETADRMADIQDSLAVMIDGAVLSSDEYSVEFTDSGFILTLPAVYTEAIVEYDAQVIADSLAGTFVDNTVMMESVNTDLVHNPAEPVEVEILKPELRIEKKADRDIYNVGDDITYTVTVEQTKEYAKAFDVVIDDSDFTDGIEIDYDSIEIMKPEGTAVVVEMPSGCYTLEESGSEENTSEDEACPEDGSETERDESFEAAADRVGFTLRADVMEYGDVITITFTGRIVDNALAGTEVFNSAMAAARNNPDIVRAVARSEVYLPELAIEKRASQEKANYMDTVEYVIEVSRTVEGARASNVSVRDTDITKGMTIDYDSISVDAGDHEYEISAPLEDDDALFEVVIDSLEYDETVTITFSAEVSDPKLIGMDVINRATATCINSSRTVKARAETPVLKPNIEMEKTEDRNSVLKDDTIRYSVVIAQSEEGAHTSGMAFEDHATDNIALDIASISITRDGKAMNSSLYTIQEGKDGFIIEFEELDDSFIIEIAYSGIVTGLTPTDSPVHAVTNTAELSYTGTDNPIISQVQAATTEPVIADFSSETPSPSPDETVSSTAPVETAKTGDSGILLTVVIASAACIAAAFLASKRKKAYQ